MSSQREEADCIHPAHVYQYSVDSSICFSPTGRHLIISENEDIIVYTLDTASCTIESSIKVVASLENDSVLISSLSISPDGSILVVSYASTVSST